MELKGNKCKGDYESHLRYFVCFEIVFLYLFSAYEE